MAEKKPRRAGAWRSLLPFLVIILIGFGLAYQFVDPAPPTRFKIGTGSPTGAYHGFALRYQGILAQDGIELELVSTAGTIQNLALLRAESGGVDAALIQGGTVAPKPGDSLLSLGSVFLEPVWVFYRGTETEELRGLRGKRIAVGPEGSGTRALAVELCRLNGFEGDPARMLSIGGVAAADQLAAGTIDGVMTVSEENAPLILRLMREPEVELLDLRRAEAYARTRRGLTHVVLPEGAIDLAANLPKVETDLIAAAANLIVSDALHPALAGALLRAALEVHADAGLFAREGEFPAAQHLEFPLSPEARRIYKYGPPFLQRYLPFWAATFIDRMKVMLLPMLALLIPLMRIFPPVYRWRMRRRIFRWYRQVRAVDVRLYEEPDAPRDEALRELDRIERDLAKVNVPLSYSDELYHLQLHIELVRRRVKARETPE